MTVSEITKSLRYRWLIFSLLGLSYILVYFHRLCPAVLAVDIMKDLNASGALTGLLGAAYFYPYALMQLPAGLLSDSWGSRKTITLFFIIAFIGSLILGISTSVFVAFIGRTLVGIGVAMLFVPTMKILAEWFHAREFAFMTGILMAMGGIGSFIAASPLVWLNSLIGWRNSFTVIGIFTLVLAVLIGIFVRNRPSDFNWPSPSDQTSIGHLPRSPLKMMNHP
ncbi:MAG: MFS transporter [Deltaproteobacteria bacterium]|nr:MFS transporter [Deltaproteobacteria bacterium]